tara:strand:- start:18 stop:368 length:351 start_codon:yes stop_codon:yes gene_type:complete
LTIDSHLPEESTSESKNTAGSNVLGFLGGLALGLLPILIVVFFVISSFYSGASVPFESSQSLLFLSSILVVAGSIFAIVKRKFGLGVGVLVGFFGGLAVIIILAFLLMAYAISSVW